MKKRIRINPVYKKELQTSTRSMKMAMTLFAYNGLLALIGLLALYVLFQNARSGGVDHRDILVIYAILTVMQFGLILFVIPAYTASAISGERERQTLEILLTTTMKPFQIIWGKLLSSISTVLLLVFSSLPVLALVFTIGGVSVGNLLQYVLLILVTAVFAGSFGLLFSVLFRRTTISTVFTYGMLIMLGGGTLAILLVIYLLIGKYYDAQYYAGLISNYRSPDLGYGVCLLLLNPAMSIAALLCGQLGSITTFSNFVGEIGTVPEFLTVHWFGISLFVQAAVAAGVLVLAAVFLNPLRRGNTPGKRRKHGGKKRGRKA